MPALRPGSRVPVARRHLRIDLGVMRTVARLSGSGAFQSIIGMASWIGLVRIVATFGSEALAGYTIREAGSRTMMVVPSPGALFTSSLPPCSSISERDIGRPGARSKHRMHPNEGRYVQGSSAADTRR